MGGNRPGSEHRHGAEDEGRAHADGDQREHVQVKRHDGAPAAFEERPTRPADHGRGEGELNPARDVAHHPGLSAKRRESGAPSRGQTPATSARHRSRSAASCRAVRCFPRRPCPRSPSSVPAPCRTWGNRRDDPAGSPGASGRCRWFCPAASAPSFLRALWWRALTETSSGSARCKSRTSLRRVRRGAPSLRPPSFRRWGLWPYQVSGGWSSSMITAIRTEQPINLTPPPS